ncbi:MAG: ribosome silencing factor [Bacilli bacterium]|nr:ribosome silencing factor [Bacilli bacterium]MCQ2794586.1 ribosome silencing factor [Bacilli bacterium]
MNQKDALKIIKKSISEKKGEKIEIIDVKSRTPFADFYIIASANNPRQIDAIKDAVVDTLEKNKIKINHVEGRSSSGWVLVDAYSYIINIFSKAERARFNLEELLNKKSK